MSWNDTMDWYSISLEISVPYCIRKRINSQRLQQLSFWELWSFTSFLKTWLAQPFFQSTSKRFNSNDLERLKHEKFYWLSNYLKAMVSIFCEPIRYYQIHIPILWTINKGLSYMADKSFLLLIFFLTSNLIALFRQKAPQKIY